jgi:hypothetical protein
VEGHDKPVGTSITDNSLFMNIQDQQNDDKSQDDEHDPQYNEHSGTSPTVKFT